MRRFPLLLLLLIVSVFGQPASPRGGEVRGRIHYSMRGPGAAPFGWASAFLSGTGLPLNLARLMKLQSPQALPLPADEDYDADVEFLLEPAARNEWDLKELNIRYEYSDRTRLSSDMAVLQDTMNDSGTVHWADGRWTGPAVWDPPAPSVHLRLFDAAVCAEPPAAVPAEAVTAPRQEHCFELQVKLFHPMLPTGRSELLVLPFASAAMDARDGEITFEFKPMPIPDISSALPSQEEGRRRMVEGMSLLLGLMEKLTGRKPPLTAEQAVAQMDLPDVRSNVKLMQQIPDLMARAFDAIRLEPDPIGFSWDQTYRGRLTNWTATDQDTFLTLTGAQAYYELEVPVFGPVLEKTDPGWYPDESFMGTVMAAHLEGAQTPVQWRFTLFDVSHEKGTCLNSEEQDSGPDLVFDSRFNDGAFSPPRKSGPNEWQIETMEPQVRPNVAIRATDYGAWGKLRAEARWGDEWVPARLEDSDQSYVTIPLDEEGGENRIADAWEKEKHITPGTDPTSDSDAEPANGKVGDGLSLYEEYRGFIAKGAYWKTDPNVKDLFIACGEGLGYDDLALFRSLSNVRTHQVLRSELGASRVINRNRNPSLSRTEQHGLLARLGALDQLVTGEARGGPGTPKDVTEIVISDQIEPEEVPGVLAHEILHGLNVMHHGIGDRTIAIWEDEEGRLYDQPPAGRTAERLPVQAAEQHGESSGNQRCLMAYTAKVFYERGGGLAFEEGHLLRKFQSPTAVNSVVCRSRRGSDFNDQGKQVGSAMYSRGNCWSQMTVSDAE